MYWYETDITFSTVNEPEQRVSKHMTYDETLLATQPWGYWDKKNKQWKKQEAQQ